MRHIATVMHIVDEQSRTPIREHPNSPDADGRAGNRGTQRDRAKSWIDGLWGYDVFIAHRRADGQEYAHALYDHLAEKKVACFLDTKVYLTGDSLTVATKRHVSKSSLLVVVGSPLLYETRETDWVEAEIDRYLEASGDDAKVVVVDFGGVLTTADEPIPDHPIARKLQHFIVEPEEHAQLLRAPCETIVDTITKQLEGRRRDTTRLRWFRALAVVLTALVVIAVLGALVALSQRASALESARIADARAAAAAAESSIDARFDVAGLIAAESYGLAPTNLGRRVMLDVVGRGEVVSAYLHDHAAAIRATSFAPKAGLMATADQAGRVILRTSDTYEVIAELDPLGPGPVRDLAFNSDGQHLALALDDGTIGLWDFTSDRPPTRFRAGAEAVRGISYSSDGAWFAATTKDGWLRVWATEEEPYRLVSEQQLVAEASGSEDSAVTDVAFSPDDSLLAATTEGGALFVYSWPDERSVLHESAPHDGQIVASLAFDPSSQWLATAGYDGSILLRSVASDAPPITLESHDGPVWALDFDLSGERLLSTSFDGTSILWDLALAQPIFTDSWHSGVVWSGRVHPNGVEVVTGGSDGSIVVRRMQNDGSLASRFRPSGGFVTQPSPDGRLLAHGGARGLVEVLDAISLEPILTVGDEATNETVLAVAFSPESDVLALGTSSGALSLWSANTGERLAAPVNASSQLLYGLAFIDQNRFVTVTFEGEVQTWTTSPLRPEGLTDSIGSAGVFDVAQSPRDGRLIVAGTPVESATWSMADGLEQVPTVPRGLNDGSIVAAAAFSNDGTLAAFGTIAEEIVLWDVVQNRAIIDIRTGRGLSSGGGVVKALAFSPDGNLLASGSGLGSIRLWDAVTGEVVGELPLPDPADTIESLGFTADSSMLVIGTRSSSVLWPVDDLRWLERACALTGRPITSEEWTVVFPSRPYRPTCEPPP